MAITEAGLLGCCHFKTECTDLHVLSVKNS